MCQQIRETNRVIDIAADIGVEQYFHVTALSGFT